MFHPGLERLHEGVVCTFFGVFFCLYVYISQTLLEASILGSGQSRQADCPHPFFPTLDYCDDFISCLLHSEIGRAHV